MTLKSIYDTDNWFQCFYFLTEQLLKKKFKLMMAYFLMIVYGLILGTLNMFLASVSNDYISAILLHTLIILSILRNAFKFMQMQCSTTNKQNNQMTLDTEIVWMQNQILDGVKPAELLCVMNQILFGLFLYYMSRLFNWLILNKPASSYQYELFLQLQVAGDFVLNQISVLYFDDQLFNSVDHEVNECMKKAEGINQFRMNYMLKVNDVLQSRLVLSNDVQTRCQKCNTLDGCMYVQLECGHQFHYLCIKDTFYDNLQMNCPKCNMQIKDFLDEG